MAGVQIQGLEKVVIGLRNLAKRHKPVSNAVVSYSAGYATRVHEDLQAHHNNGSAKFLEIAARTTTAQVATVVRQEIGNGATMESALLSAGFIVLEASNTLVPVLSGFLKASGRVDVK